MAVAVRCPTGGHAIREPHASIGFIDAPITVRVEVFIADHVLRHIARRLRVFVATVAITGPAVEVIEAWCVNIFVITQAGPRETVRLPRINDVRSTISICFTLTAAHENVRGIAVAIYADPVFTGLRQRESQVRRGHLKYLIAAESTHAHVQCPLGQSQLGDAVVEIENGNAGIGTHANHCAADLNFSARTGIHPNAVAGRKRPIDRGAYPVALTRR